MTSGFIALAAYLAATVTVAHGLWHRRGAMAAAGVWLAVPALAAHVVYLVMRIGRPDGWDMNILNALSLVSAVIVALVLMTTPRRRLVNTGVVVFPGAALWLALQLGLDLPPVVLRDVDWLTELHVACSLVAYGTLSIAALTALVVAVQDRILRHHGPPRLLEVLPPLAWLESVMFRLIAGGWVVLTISLVSGGLWIEDLLTQNLAHKTVLFRIEADADARAFAPAATLALVSGLLFVDNLFAQHLAHKTFLSIISWLVFGLLLAGRWRYGWRGRTALSLTLAGMAFLLLAYFGSKLVLELLLSETWTRAGA